VTSYLVGLIGSGIQGSLTPLMHESEAARLQLDYEYRLIDLTERREGIGELGAILVDAEREGFAAVNITHPAKQAVLEHLDELSDQARALRAVNLVRFKGGRRIGDNTDITGFRTAVLQGLPDARRDEVVQVGAGGAGAATAFALLSLGTRRLGIADIDPDRARGLAALLEPAFPEADIDAIEPDRLTARLGAADGALNTTPIGMAAHPGVSFDPSLLPADGWIGDVVYFPIRTELLTRAEATGHRTLDGGWMAVGQAWDSLRLITGLQPDLHRMREDFLGFLDEGPIAQPMSEEAAEIRTSIATVCLSGSLEEKLEAISAAGFDGIELFENDLVTSPLPPEAFRRIADGLGLSVDLYQPFRDYEQVHERDLPANLRRAERKFDLMTRLGVDLILVCSNVATAVTDEDRVAVDHLGALADLAARFDIRIAYEALAWGRNVSTLDHAWRIVERVGADNLGVCVDSFHVLARGTDPAVLDTIPGDRVFFCQLADAPALQLDVLTWSRHHRLFPGEGDWDLSGFVARLVRAGYRGPLSLEVFNDTFRQTDPVQTALDARRSLTVLEDGAHAAIGEADGAGLLAPLPPVDVSGVAFVELRPDAEGRLTATLDALGLGELGRHRRKPVRLFGGGRARFVVNDGLPAGPGDLVAVGFEVVDVDAAVRRASSLGCEVLPRNRVAGEDVLLAVRAPDDTEIYFSHGGPGVEPGWLGEFGVNGASTGDARIDHVALVQPWQRAHEARLFFRSVLGLEVGAEVDVAAQAGLMQSRTLHGHHGDLRLVLNVAPVLAEGSRSFADHVAVAVPDVLAVARGFGAGGVPRLPIPDNYYDDLEARFGLPQDRLGELRRLAVLYDRQGSGEFLQLFTAPIGGVVFEIVQRSGGYPAYGEPNAPVRLAAQRALLDTNAGRAATPSTV
jgi:4-hydroxyphenylpyruvate dioxygenase